MRRLADALGGPGYPNAHAESFSGWQGVGGGSVGLCNSVSLPLPAQQRPEPSVPVAVLEAALCQRSGGGGSFIWIHVCCLIGGRSLEDGLVYTQRPHTWPSPVRN